MSRSPYLIVERGYPFEWGTALPLKLPRLVLGRKDERWEPDVAFENAFVSRKQAEIVCEDGAYSLMDLGSKHGTALNGQRLAPFVPALLGDSDRISFAKDMVVLTFSPVRLDVTLDFAPLFPEGVSLSDRCRLDAVRQTVQIQGDSYPLSEKEFRFLELLMRKERQFVGREEVVRYVWPERDLIDPLSAASAEEMNSLLYRLRKKTNHRIVIESIRGKGYIFQDILSTDDF